MYLPLRGSQTTIWLLGSKPEGVSSVRFFTADTSHTLEGQIVDLEALMRAFVVGDNWGIADQRVMNTRIWDQVGLELIQVDIEGSIEAKTGSNRTNNLGN